MPINLIEGWTVNLAQVLVKFEPSVKVSTITNDRFILHLNGATPSIVSSDPFKDITTATDYNTISKSLALDWKSNVLSPNTAYRLIFSGFRTANNEAIDDDYIDFVTEGTTVPSPGDVPYEPLPVYVEDHSIIGNPIHAEEESEQNSNQFRLLSSDPPNGDAFVPEAYHNGMIILKFSHRPNSSYLTDQYFTVERKPIQRKPSRWEPLDIIISIDGDKPWVYLQLPNSETDPIDTETGIVYNQHNSKYRVKISGEVGV